ncbi:hypothetical protein J2X54_000202 [Duganella sp. 3397]|uniref:hypothetical protein n=1 Tax=Duganella sp. 3397 TaxID=2817732 RepID=UPI0028577F2E|nr:hypothetical protein [Duganella sp. 3397]MDR7047767.1 hypothetical protein [Duganella sp. 3397]
MDDNNLESSEFMQRLMEFQVPVCVKNAGTYEQKGTATLLRILDDYFIVTAAHVTHLRHQSADRSIYLYNHHLYEFIQVTEDIFGHDDATDVANEFDISIIKINKENYKEIPDESFLPFHMFLLPNTLLENHAYIASGYPSSKNRSFPKYKHRATSCVLITKEACGDGQPLGELINLHLSYDAADAPDPFGMSGGAIWTITTNLEVNPALSGILVSYNEKENRLTAVKIDYVIALIQAFFPGTLVDHIDLPFFIVLNEHGGSIHFPTIPVVA